MISINRVAVIQPQIQREGGFCRWGGSGKGEEFSLRIRYLSELTRKNPSLSAKPSLPTSRKRTVPVLPPWNFR